VSLGVGATGDGLTYQWYQGTSGKHVDAACSDDAGADDRSAQSGRLLGQGLGHVRLAEQQYGARVGLHDAGHQYTAGRNERLQRPDRDADRVGE